MTCVRVYIGLGSNLNNPAQQINRALEALSKLPKSQLQKTSRFYSNPPMGPQDQPDFINAVAALDTELEPLELLECLQKIEQQQGRERNMVQRWGPRTLDLDILLYGNIGLKTENLTIPHPGLNYRDFVLIPLREIAPDLKLEKMESI